MTAVLHDFRKPLRLQATWQNRLSGWFRTALTLATKTWEKTLPGSPQATFKDLEAVFAKEALDKLPDGSVGYRVFVDGSRLPSLLVVPRSLLLKLVGVMLGDTEATVEDRELTMVEENLAEYFLTQFWLPHFRDSWPGSHIVSWQMNEREPQPQCSRFVPAADVLMALGVTIKGPWGESNGCWFFQQKALLETFGANAPAVEPVSEAVLASRREAMVMNLPMQVEIVLGTAELKLSQLSNLQVGDVVLLDQHQSDEIIARTGDRVLFRGQAGRSGTWQAMRIDEVPH